MQLINVFTGKPNVVGAKKGGPAHEVDQRLIGTRQPFAVGSGEHDRNLATMAINRLRPTVFRRVDEFGEVSLWPPEYSMCASSHPM